MNKSIKNLGLIFSTLLSLRVSGEPMKDYHKEADPELRLSRIIKISNIKGFNARIEEMHALENRKEECDIQLRHEMLPTSCFEVIRLEKKLSLLSNDKYLETRSWLTDNCIDRASQIKEINHQIRNLNSLPPKCLELVREKMGDQHYRDITLNPVALFKQRF